MKQTSSILANELRKYLASIFEYATETKEKKAMPPGGTVPMDAATHEDYQYCLAEIDRCVRANLKPNSAVTLPNGDIISRLHAPLAFKPFFTFEAWHLAPNISDEDIIASKQAILKGNLSALEKFRDPSRQSDISMPLDNNYHEYMLLLGNLAYFLKLLARLSKRLNLPETGRTCLLAAHHVIGCKTRCAPNFTEEDISRFEELFDKGLFELQTTLEYNEMEPWETFRKRAAKELAENDAAAAAQAKGTSEK